MTMPYTIQDVRNIILRPHAGQFVIDELPLIFMCMAGLVYGGMEGMPLGGMATVIALFLFLVLLYRFICLYNPQIQISAESGTKRSIFRQKNKTKRSKKRLHTTLIKPEQKVNEDLCSGFIVS